jgi:uncharacterized protein (TIGR02271 family)
MAQVREGMDVLDRNGDKIGKAGETVGQFFNLDAGFLGTKEYWVPLQSVSEVQENAVFLNVNKDDIDSMGWDRKPEDAASIRGAAGASATTSEAETLRLREEELRARKTPVETGRVEVGKEVVEEQKSFEVPVSREEVVVERHAVERRPSDEPIKETEGQRIDVPVREERVEVEKRPVVYEEVGVGKRATQETEEVSETVRREELRLDKEGDIEVQGEPGTRNP